MDVPDRKASAVADAEVAPAWHTLSAQAIGDRLGVAVRRGLGADEVARRRERHGPNALREAPPRHWSAMLLGQFRDFMILVLLAAAALAGLTGDLQDVVVILAIVILNAVIGFVQEYRAEAAIHALRRMAAPSASVRREGRVEIMPADRIVPGDVVLLEALVDVDEPCLRGAYAAEPHLPPLEEESSRLGRIRKSIQGLIYREGRGD